MGKTIVKNSISNVHLAHAKIIENQKNIRNFGPGGMKNRCKNNTIIQKIDILLYHIFIYQVITLCRDLIQYS